MKTDAEGGQASKTIKSETHRGNLLSTTAQLPPRIGYVHSAFLSACIIFRVLSSCPRLLFYTKRRVFTSLIFLKSTIQRIKPMTHSSTILWLQKEKSLEDYLRHVTRCWLPQVGGMRWKVCYWVDWKKMENVTLKISKNFCLFWALVFDLGLEY